MSRPRIAGRELGVQPNGARFVVSIAGKFYGSFPDLSSANARSIEVQQCLALGVEPKPHALGKRGRPRAPVCPHCGAPREVQP